MRCCSSAIALGLELGAEECRRIVRSVALGAGSAYLIWLGIQAWRSAGYVVEVPPRARVHFWRGFVVALTNPKTIAFFTAFLPQFVDPSLPAEPQLLVMCTMSILIAWISIQAGRSAPGLGRAFFLKPSRVKLLGRMSGAVLIGGGIWLSLARRPV